MEEGMSVFGGVQLALDATLVSAHHGDDTPLRKANNVDGIALQHARKRKETRYPVLCELNGRARLVVITGSGRTLVPRNQGIPARRGTREGAGGSPYLAGMRTGGVVPKVVQLVGVFGCQSRGGFFSGEAGGPWSRRTLVFGARGV